MAAKGRRSHADIAAMKGALSDTPDKLLWNIKQAAAVLGLSVPFIRLETARERLPALKAGCRLMYKRETIRAYIDALPRASFAPAPSQQHLPKGFNPPPPRKAAAVSRWAQPLKGGP
jgi:hypothetical protein